MGTLRDDKDMSTVPAAMLEVARGWKSGACRREIIESGAKMWPRSCPRCGIAKHGCDRVNKLDDKTIRLVDDFAFEMKMKLVRAMERKGKSGWESPDWKDECIEELIKHVAKGDPLDVGAYAAFCWYHKWPTWPENES